MESHRKSGCSGKSDKGRYTVPSSQLRLPTQVGIGRREEDGKATQILKREIEERKRERDERSQLSDGCDVTKNTEGDTTELYCLYGSCHRDDLCDVSTVQSAGIRTVFMGRIGGN